METLYTKKEVAEYLKISVRSIDRILDQFNIPAFRAGRQVRIPESSLHLMLQKGITGTENQKIVKRILGE